MGTEAGNGEHTADLTAVDHIARHNGALHVETLGIVDHVLAAGVGDGLLCGGQLIEGGEGSLVGEIVLACRHGAQTETAALAGDGGAGDEVGVLILEGLLLASCGDGLRIVLQESGDLFGVGVPDILQGSAGLQKTVGHAVDVAVIQAYRGEDKFTGLDHGLCFALRGVIHTVCCVHNFVPFFMNILFFEIRLFSSSVGSEG